MSKKIILDVDTGMDDAIAIAMAAISPEIDILGITVVHGNQPLEYTLENTLRVVEFLEKPIPVYAGCPEPMVQFLSPGRLMNVRRQVTQKTVGDKVITIHPKYIKLPQATILPERKHACSYIIEMLKEAREKLTIVAVGPLTNIGMALRMDPSITSNIDEIVIMGGGDRHGNRTPVAEANFYDDPEAAQIVMQSGCKIRLLTLDATETVLLTKTDAQRLRKLSRTGAFMADIIEEYIDNCTLLGITEKVEVSVHDAVAVCAVIDPSVITDIRHRNCDVDFSGGFSDGQLVVDNRSYVKVNHQTYVAYEVDKAKFLDILEETLKA